MIDRDALLSNVKYANPVPGSNPLPADIADSRPPLAFLIDARTEVATWTKARAVRGEVLTTPRWRFLGIAGVAALLVALIVAIPLLILSMGDEATPTATTLPATEATPAPVVSSTTVTSQAAGSQRPIIEVTFDGEECSLTGPVSVPARVGQAFVLTNDSDIGVVLHVARIRYDHFDQLAHGEDGVKFETFADLVMIYETDPAVINEYLLLEEEPFSFDPEHYPPVGRAGNQVLDVRLLTVGEDAIYVESTALERIWFCAPLEVTEIEF